jgi:hypothetical protein
MMPRPSPILLFHIVLGSVFSSSCFAQKKFELGLRFDGLNIQFDNTYEGGLGTYDINTKRNITQSAYADLMYWPHQNFGISLGIGLHDFQSEIRYSIPSPSSETILVETSDQITARGLGYIASVHFRKDRWRVRIGYALFELYNQEYPSRYRLISVTSFEPGLGVLASLDVIEKSYWQSIPIMSGLIQMEGQYRVIDQLFVRLGFETTHCCRKYYPYTVQITGFTQQTTMDDHLFNDFRIRNMYTAFSVGIAYYLGFGRYRADKEIE